MTLVASIEGYASVFDEADMNGDIVARGAFASRRPASDIRMLYQHAAEAPIGRWLSLEEDRRGLYARGELLLSSETAREAHALLEGGAIDGLSIGFQTVRSRKEGAARLILEADLWEVSVVTFPMAAGARVLRVAPPAPAEGTPTSAGAIFAATLRDAARLARAEVRGAATAGDSAARGPGSAKRRIASHRVRDDRTVFQTIRTQSKQE